MTDKAPTTRLQQLMAKSEAGEKLTDEESLLDLRAGIFVVLEGADNPPDVRKFLLEFIDICDYKGYPPLLTIGPAAMAATLQMAERLMVSENFAETRARDVMLKLSAVYGLRPQMLEGVKVQTIAEIMERDLDVPALEKSLQRFGFEIKDGAIGAWTGPQAPAPAAPKPPRQLG